jgi:hypothetical protein
MPFSFHVHEAMNHIIIGNFIFFLHIENKSITQVCIIHVVTKSCFHNLYPRKYSLPYCIAIGTTQVSKVDKPMDNKDFFVSTILCERSLMVFMLENRLSSLTSAI